MPRAAKPSILDVLNSPPSSPAPIQGLKPRAARRELKSLSSSGVNNRQKVKMEGYFNGKWVDDEDVVDLSMLDDDDAPQIRRVLKPVPAAERAKKKLLPDTQQLPSAARTSASPSPQPTTRVKKSASPPPELPLPARTKKSASPLLEFPNKMKRKLPDPFPTLLPASKRAHASPGPSQPKKWLGAYFSPLSRSPTPTFSHNPVDDDDDDPVPAPAPMFSLASLIDSIPLADRAPVGRRRLVKKKDLDEDSDDSDDESVTPEEQIESDKRMIATAAEMLGCKKAWVNVTRKEEVAGADERGEAAVAVGVVEEVMEEEGKGKGKGLLDAFLEEEEDEDMVLRRPGEKGKGKGKEKEKEKEAPVGVNDDMEWIRGYDLGQRHSGRQFKSVVERRQLWRVPGMYTPLLDHQVLGVDWMVRREYSAKKPRGGLVADAMGLGKTIQSIATMVVNPAPPAEKDTDPTVTLIVAPVALLQQWKDELTLHAKPGNFSIHIHHGKNRLPTVAALRKHDVIITSYGAICNSYPSTRKPRGQPRMSATEEEIWWDAKWRTRGIFHKLKFWRVILDEAHIIKNRNSRTSLACQNLKALHTWALSGTPIQNSLEDVYPIFNFMRHPHVGGLEQFRAVAGKGGEAAAKRVQALLRGCMMRRMKKDQLMGRDLVVLEKKRVRMVELEFGSEERGLYKCVEDMSREVMNKYIREGTVMKHYSHVLVMLLRLRQICDHPYLILTTINKHFTVTDLDRALPGTPGTTSKSGLRQILDAARITAMGDITECSICLDSPEAPVITKCRHVFCHDCISNFISECARSGNPTACPLCKEPLQLDDLANYRADTPEDDDVDEDDRGRKEQNWLLNAGEFMHSAKTMALRDQLLEWRENHPGDKVVLFSQFTKMLDIVEKVLDEEGWGCVRYQGDMTMVEREEALRRFRVEGGEEWVMLTSLRAGGVGLNLVCANLVMSLDLWWNGAVELQAFDRVHRMGQKKEVFVSRFIVKDTVEQRILDLQRKKERIANAALGDGVGTNLGKLTQRELMGLFGNVVDGPGGLRIVANEEEEEGEGRGRGRGTLEELF